MFCYSEAEKENYHDYDPIVICFTYLDRIDSGQRLENLGERSYEGLALGVAAEVGLQ